MIKNIITSGANSGELEILRTARSFAVSTGGFCRNLPAEDFQCKLASRRGEVYCDQINLRAADLTVVIQLDDRLGQAAKNRMERIWVNRNRRNVVRSFVDGECTSIAQECLRLGVEVINFVSIQEDRESCEAGPRLAWFMANFFREAEQIIEKKSPSIWHETGRWPRLRRRPTYRGPVAEYSRTGYQRFLPGVQDAARKEIFELVSGLQIDQSLKRIIYDSASDQFFEKIRNIDITKRNGNWFDTTWTTCAVESVRNHLGLPRKSAATLGSLTRQLSWKAGGRGDFDQIVFGRMCAITADTSLRPERFLRTLLMLHLGGLRQSRTGFRIVSQLMRQHQQANCDFSRRELNRRFQSVGGWNAVRDAGAAHHRDNRNDPFRYLQRDESNRPRLESELFLAADEFRCRQEFWNPQWLAAFCRAICFLCGTDETLWRSWIGPPYPFQFLSAEI